MDLVKEGAEIAAEMAKETVASAQNYITTQMQNYKQHKDLTELRKRRSKRTAKKWDRTTLQYQFFNRGPKPVPQDPTRSGIP